MISSRRKDEVELAHEEPGADSPVPAPHLRHSRGLGLRRVHAHASTAVLSKCAVQSAPSSQAFHSRGHPLVVRVPPRTVPTDFQSSETCLPRRKKSAPTLCSTVAAFSPAVVSHAWWRLPARLVRVRAIDGDGDVVDEADGAEEAHDHRRELSHDRRRPAQARRDVADQHVDVDVLAARGGQRRAEERDPQRQARGEPRRPPMSISADAFWSQLRTFDDQATPACTQRRPRRGPSRPRSSWPGGAPSHALACHEVRDDARRRRRDEGAVDEADDEPRAGSRPTVLQRDPQRQRDDLGDEHRRAHPRFDPLPGGVETLKGTRPARQPPSCRRPCRGPRYQAPAGETYKKQEGAGLPFEGRLLSLVVCHAG